MNARPAFRILAGALLLAGPLAAQFTSGESAEAYTRRAIALFRGGDLEAGVAMLDQSTLPENADEVALGIHELLKAIGEEADVVLVNRWWMKSFTKEFRADELVFHIVGDRYAALLFARVASESGQSVLTRFNVQSAPVDLKDRYPLVLFGVSPLHYLCAFLVVLIPIFMVIAAVRAIRSDLRRKWPWAIVAFLSVGRFVLYWLPGPLTLSMVKTGLFTVSLLGVGMQKQPIYDP